MVVRKSKGVYHTHEESVKGITVGANGQQFRGVHVPRARPSRTGNVKGNRTRINDEVTAGKPAYRFHRHTHVGSGEKGKKRNQILI